MFHVKISATTADSIASHGAKQTYTQFKTTDHVFLNCIKRVHVHL